MNETPSGFPTCCGWCRSHSRTPSGPRVPQASPPASSGGVSPPGPLAGARTPRNLQPGTAAVPGRRPVRLPLRAKAASLLAVADTGEMKAVRFEVAFSFAGAHREQVRAIAELVSAAIDPGITDRSKGRVFFDEWFEHEILGDDMDVLLQRFYHQQSRMVVADLSDDYAGRPWCQAEARAIRALRFEIDPARDETGRLRLLNLKLGEGDAPGIFKTTGQLDGIQNSAPKCAELILQRHALFVERMAAADAAEKMVGRGVLTPPSATRTPPPPGGALGTARPANASHSGQTPDAPRGRSWVWHSTLATRAAGQVSVLACVETLFAVVLYWWIAIR